MTYDDGPVPARARTAVAALDAAGFRATFFMVGSLAATYPYVAARVADWGHVVAIQTYNH